MHNWLHPRLVGIAHPAMGGKLKPRDPPEGPSSQGHSLPAEGRGPRWGARGCPGGLSCWALISSPGLTGAGSAETRQRRAVGRGVPIVFCILLPEAGLAPEAGET